MTHQLSPTPLSHDSNRGRLRENIKAKPQRHRHHRLTIIVSTMIVLITCLVAIYVFSAEQTISSPPLSEEQLLLQREYQKQQRERLTPTTIPNDSPVSLQNPVKPLRQVVESMLDALPKGRSGETQAAQVKNGMDRLTEGLMTELTQTQPTEAGSGTRPDLGTNIAESPPVKAERSMFVYTRPPAVLPVTAPGSSSQNQSFPVESGPVCTTVIYNSQKPIKVFEGEWLDGVLMNEIQADSESSPLNIWISKDFFDNDNHYIIFPTGTRIVGYSQIVSSQGASRLFSWFTRMILPNGIDINFPAGKNSLALDYQGRLGVVSTVNRHFFRKFGNAIFFGILDGLGGLAQSNLSPYSSTSRFIERSQHNLSQVNQEIFQQMSSIVPTICVKAGHRIKIHLSCDILITPYDLVKNRSYAK
jgi:type IV secretory pathway VirB10-like protein